MSEKHTERPLTDDEIKTIKSMGQYWREVVQRDDSSSLHDEASEIHRMFGVKILWVFLAYVEFASAPDMAETIERLEKQVGEQILSYGELIQERDEEIQRLHINCQQLQSSGNTEIDRQAKQIERLRVASEIVADYISSNPGHYRCYGDCNKALLAVKNLRAALAETEVKK